jgi:hypothetical protein
MTEPRRGERTGLTQPRTFRNRSARKSRSFYALVVCTLSLLAPMHAQKWGGAQAELAAKIVALTGPGTISVELINKSSLSRNEADEIRRGILTELAARGAQFVTAERAATTVKIYLSEDPTNYLWIAEVRQGAGEPAIAMVSVPRPDAPLSERDAITTTIHKGLLWSQETPILDVALIDGNPSNMLVLDDSNVGVYRLQGAGWQQEQLLPIPHSKPWPRDLRGRLALKKDHLFDAYLPGVHCKSTTAAPLAMSCYETDDPWPIGTDQAVLSAFFAPARNFFTGALAPPLGSQNTVPAFYSAAHIASEKYTLWLVAAVDGHVHFADGIRDQVAAKLAWGSDLATVHSDCGSGWQVLASTTSNAANDIVQAFEFPDREAIPASQAADFNGAITALWAETSGASAIAIVHNSATGKYDAFRLTIDCGR